MNGLFSPGIPYQPPAPLIQAPNPGLLGPTQPGINPALLGQNSRIAYGLAGNPSMGPFAQVAPPPTQPYTLGSSTSAGGAATGGLLGTAAGLLQDYRLGKTGLSALQGLFGPSTAAYASGSVGNAALQGAVNANGGIPSLTNTDLGLTPGGGVPNGSAGGASVGGDAAAAAGAVGTGGLLGGSAGTGAVTITDAAGNVLAGTGAADGIGTAAGASGGTAAASGAGTGTAATGSAASSGIGAAAGAATGAYLAYQLGSGLLSGTGHPINSVASGDAQAWTNDFLDQSGPGLKSIAGDGSAAYPMTVLLKDGTQLTGDQYQQLTNMTQKFIQGNNANNGVLGSNKGLTADQTQQLNTYIKSVATPAPAASSAPAQQSPADTAIANKLANMNWAAVPPAQIAAIQQMTQAQFQQWLAAQP